MRAGLGCSRSRIAWQSQTPKIQALFEGVCEFIGLEVQSDYIQQLAISLELFSVDWQRVPLYSIYWEVALWTRQSKQSVTGFAIRIHGTERTKSQSKIQELLFLHLY